MRINLSRIIISAILCAIASYQWTGFAHASTDPQTSDSVVSATIPQATATPGSDTTPPTIPLLQRPVDGAVTADTTPELVWLRATDPNSNYVVYTVYLNDVATYLGVSDTGNASGNNYTSTVYDNEVRVIPTTSLSDGMYTWKVRATDASGNYRESTLWSFVIDTIAPPLSIEQLGPHAYPTIEEGSLFEVPGPGTVALHILSDPYVDIRVTATSEIGTVYTHQGKTDSSGRIILTDLLELGNYQYQISATDAANLTSLLPLFTLSVVSPEIVIPIPGVSPPPVIKVPSVVTQIASSLYNYPATVSQVATRVDIATIIVASLALLALVLLILLKYRHNLSLYGEDAQPLRNAQVTHRDSRNRETMYALVPRDAGRLYIRGLSSHSMLTIHQHTQTTHLCLTQTRNRYTITLS